MPDFKLQLLFEETKTTELVEISMPEEEWEIIERFQSEVKRLEATRFVQEGLGGSLSLTFHHEKGTSSKADSYDEEATGNMLLRLRPLVLQSEDTYFYKVLRRLNRYSIHQAMRDHLLDIQKLFELQVVQPFSVFAPVLGRPPMKVDEVLSWLNAYEYHRDISKQKASREMLGTFGRDRDGAPAVLFSLVEMIKAIQRLNQYIETLVKFDKSDEPIVVKQQS